MPKTTPDKSLTGTCSPPKCIPNKRKTVLRIFLAAFAVLLVFSLAAAPVSAVQTYKFNSSTGSGSVDSPFVITEDKDLALIATAVNSGGTLYSDNSDKPVPADGASYKLGENIDLSTVCSATNGSWTPIGEWDVNNNNKRNTFQGTFDGGNHIISNLYINTPSVDFQGLFGYTDSATIKNLGVINVDITGNQQVGGLVGWNSGTITNCYATGNVTGTQNVGGLVGRSSRTITNCFVTVDVTGDYTIGGLVGWNTGTGNITNCYAAGAVNGTVDQIGGLVGFNDGGGKIRYSVALNQFVNGSSNVRRVVGSGSCDNTCYAWEGMTDGESSSSLFSNGGNNGNAAASAQVWNNTSFYNSTLSWDFSTIWKFNMTNQKYILPVLQMNPDTTGLDASHLDPSAPININLCKITITNVTYNSREQSPIVNVSRNGVIFTDANYTVTGNTETAAGDYKLTITGKGKIAGSVIKDWNISKAALSPANFTCTAPSNLVYDGTEKTAQVVEANRIYGIGNISITYHNATTNTAQLPIAVGTYNVSISVTEGTNYTAASDLHASGWNFTIQPLNINSNVTVSLSETSYTYDGNPKEPTVNVTKGLTLLREYIDYNVTGDKTETSVGEYNITVTGINNYTGLIDITWNITKAPLYPENFTYTAPSNLVYDGTAKTAQVVEANRIHGIGNISITYHNATTNTEQSPIAAGTYNVNISVTDGTNYTAASNLHASGWNFTIQPLNISPENGIIVHIESGWNFISIPNTLNTSNNTAAAVFSSINTDNNSILTFDAKNQTWNRTLNNDILQPMTGYWIYSVDAKDITLEFNSDSSDIQNKEVYEGWNTIGIRGTEPISAHNFLLNSDWKKIIRWDTSNQEHIIICENGGTGTTSDEKLEPTVGYWVYEKSNNTIYN